MAGKVFTHDEWKRIRTTLEADPAQFGLPERVYGSALVGSFNIRKLGAASKRNNNTWNFLADVCRRFDLLAVQEIQDDLEGLRKLKDLMGPEFAMIVSDRTGVFPGEPGLVPQGRCGEKAPARPRGAGISSAVAQRSGGISPRATAALQARTKAS